MANGSVAIPERDSSPYSGQYSGSVDSSRIMQIFRESCTIALKTKRQSIAEMRYGLAVETYHQLQVMLADQSARALIRASMFTFLELFPIQVVFREVNRHLARAARLRTPTRRIESFRHAAHILESAVIQTPRCRDFHDALARVRAELGAIDSQPR